MRITFPFIKVLDSAIFAFTINLILRQHIGISWNKHKKIDNFKKTILIAINKIMLMAGQKGSNDSH